MPCRVEARNAVKRGDVGGTNGSNETNPMDGAVRSPALPDCPAGRMLDYTETGRGDFDPVWRLSGPRLLTAETRQRGSGLTSLHQPLSAVDALHKSFHRAGHILGQRTDEDTAARSAGAL